MSELILYEGRFFLEFTVVGEIGSLEKIFAALKLDKDARLNDESASDETAQNSVSESKWLEYLNESAQNYFIDSKDAEEERVFWELWKLTAPAVRLSHPMFNQGENWDLEAMVGAIFNGEYTLDEIRKLDESRAVLIYNPWSIPFGGSDSLVVLIESFGHRVTYDYWHEGPHRRGEIGWNYKLARALVAAQKGFVPSD